MPAPVIWNCCISHGWRPPCCAAPTTCRCSPHHLLKETHNEIREILVIDLDGLARGCAWPRTHTPADGQCETEHGQGDRESGRRHDYCQRCFARRSATVVPRRASRRWLGHGPEGGGAYGGAQRSSAGAVAQQHAGASTGGLSRGACPL